MPSVIHLFLDLENVQPTAAQLELVRGPHFRLWVLHGPHQKDFTADRVRAWQPLGEQVRFVQSTKAGKNALDLHIAFCMGEARERDGQQGVSACYVIVSNDKGFDALFGYLSSVKSRVGRADSLPTALKLAEDLSGKQSELKPKAEVRPKAKSVSENTQRVLRDLREHPRTQPTTEKRLRNHIASLLGTELEGQVVIRVLAELKAIAAVTLQGSKLKYSLQGKQVLD